VRKKAARIFVWTTMETTMQGKSGGESLSFSLNLFSGVVEENIQEKIMCV
jgi:hypothetical protein